MPTLFDPSFHRPEVLTKELKVQQVPGVGRRVRLSTNFLRDFGFNAGTRLDVQLGSRKGIIVPSDEGNWKVHERSYRRRKNNPTESVIEFASQPLLDRMIPAGHDRVHFTLSRGRIEVRPVRQALFYIRKRFRSAESLEAFMALSSGLDAWTFREAGFNLAGVLEYRPQEARDTIDLTETGICTFLRNNAVKLAFNEDITTIDIERVGRLVEERVGPLAVISCAVQCDDFSNAKSARLKEREIAEFRPSSRELGYYATKLIERLQPASVFIENVPGWHGSESQGVIGAVLSRLGYHVQATILNGADFGAFTARKRCYFVASIFPGFEFPEPTGRNTIPLRQILNGEVNSMVDVSHTAAVTKARGTPRARFTSLDSVVAPTVLKSQARLTKDSLYFEEEGKILRPTTKILRKLHSMPDEIHLDAVSDEIAVEQIGQGIEFPLHTAVATALRNHLERNRSRGCQLSLGL
jgi:DNA (cytosine-5)-methyltransferase 1